MKPLLEFSQSVGQDGSQVDTDPRISNDERLEKVEFPDQDLAPFHGASRTAVIAVKCLGMHTDGIPWAVDPENDFVSFGAHLGEFYSSVLNQGQLGGGLSLRKQQLVAPE
jgi:hypothetical protein